MSKISHFKALNLSFTDILTDFLKFIVFFDLQSNAHLCIPEGLKLKNKHSIVIFFKF